MGSIFVTEFISLDGVVEDPGGAEGYRHAGWSFAFDRGEDGDRYKLQETMESDALLLGRRTFEGFAAAWPERDGPFAEKFNSMPKYVVSNTLAEPSWSNSTVLAGDPVDQARRLKEELDGAIQIAGSVQLVQALIEADLVDELRLMVFPVLLGEGKRLWGQVSDKKSFALADTKVFGEGVALLTLRRP
jgi:dihydrofolate reductase